MKTKREVLESIGENEGCHIPSCSDCPYSSINTGIEFSCIVGRLTGIGARAILRMFPEKETRLICVDDFPPYIKKYVEELEVNSFRIYRKNKQLEEENRTLKEENEQFIAQIKKIKEAWIDYQMVKDDDPDFHKYVNKIILGKWEFER